MRHPRNRVGILLVAAGLVWFLPELSNPGVGSRFAFTLGLVGFVATAPIVAHVALAYPRGRLGSTLDRLLVASAYAGSILLLGLFPTALFDPVAQGCHQCPSNLILVRGDQRLVDGLDHWGIRLGLVWTIALLLLMAWRLLRSSRSILPLVGPVLVPAAFYILLVAWEFLHSLDRGILSTDRFDQRIWRYEAAALFFLALGVGWGLLRGARTRASVARLVVDLGRSPRPGGVRDALAQALGDSSLELAYVRDNDDGYVSAEGSRVEIETGPGRTTTPLLREGQPFAILTHSQALLDDPGLLGEAVSAARLAVANERLQALVRAQLEDLRASRARIIESGDAERRKLELDLHDGAQQRLVGLSLALELLRSHAGTEPDSDIVARIGVAQEELRQALSELRDVAHGIHPAVLSDEGLAAAVETLAERSQVRIVLGALPAQRLPAPVEAAAYFAIAEAVKGAEADVAVDVVHDDDWLVTVVRRPTFATNPHIVARFTEIADRVGALDGHLDVETDSGDTVIRAEIPCG
jgi:signal transduction histidine kinase